MLSFLLCFCFYFVVGVSPVVLPLPVWCLVPFWCSCVRHFHLCCGETCCFSLVVFDFIVLFSSLGVECWCVSPVFGLLWVGVLWWVCWALLVCVVGVLCWCSSLVVWLCCSVRGFARACCFVCGCCWCVFLFGGVLCCVGSSEFLCWCVAGLALGRCWSVGVFVAVLFMVLFLWSCCFWFVTILGFCCFEKSHLLVAGVWCCPLLLLFDSALVCHPCFVYGSVQHHVVSGCPCSGSCSFIHYYGSVLYFYCSCCFWFSRF